MTFKLTPEQREHATAAGCKILIKATEDQIKEGRYRNDIADLQEDLAYLKDLLEEIEGRKDR